MKKSLDFQVGTLPTVEEEGDSGDDRSINERLARHEKRAWMSRSTFILSSLGETRRFFPWFR
ncbi:MAG: hypothetical protein AAGE99_05830 [Chlamydiota bacterium]